MSALLWYKISDFMARSLCHNSLPEFKKSSLTTKYEECKTMATLMVSYTSTLHWNGFFREAASQRAYSNLETAMTLINKRITSMEFYIAGLYKTRSYRHVHSRRHLQVIWLPAEIEEKHIKSWNDQKLASVYKSRSQ